MLISNLKKPFALHVLYQKKSALKGLTLTARGSALVVKI